MSRLKSIRGGKGGKPPEPPEPPLDPISFDIEAELAEQPVSKLIEGVVARLISLVDRDNSVPAAKAAAVILREFQIAAESGLHNRRVEIMLKAKAYPELIEYLARIGATLDDVYGLIGLVPELEEHYERGILKARLESLAVQHKRTALSKS